MGDFNVAATYFSTSVRGSIIGPLELNCRVRDGNGCGLQGKATTKVTFTEPGAYRLRVYGDDGVLATPIDVNVTVLASR